MERMREGGMGKAKKREMMHEYKERCRDVEIERWRELERGGGRKRGGNKRNGDRWT